MVKFLKILKASAMESHRGSLDPSVYRGVAPHPGAIFRECFPLGSWCVGVVSSHVRDTTLGLERTEGRGGPGKGQANSQNRVSSLVLCVEWSRTPITGPCHNESGWCLSELLSAYIGNKKHSLRQRLALRAHVHKQTCGPELISTTRQCLGTSGHNTSVPREVKGIHTWGASCASTACDRLHLFHLRLRVRTRVATMETRRACLRWRRAGKAKMFWAQAQVQTSEPSTCTSGRSPLALLQRRG